MSLKPFDYAASLSVVVALAGGAVIDWRWTMLIAGVIGTVLFALAAAADPDKKK